MAAPVPLRTDFDATQLRALAKQSRDADQTRTPSGVGRDLLMEPPAPRRPRSAASHSRSCGTGCCASTPEDPRAS
jgi:hypothetical protein